MLENINPVHLVIGIYFGALIIAAMLAVAIFLLARRRPRSPVEEFLADAPGDVPHLPKGLPR